MENKLVNILMGETLYVINEIQGEEYTYILGKGKVTYQGEDFIIDTMNHLFYNPYGAKSYIKEQFYIDIAKALKVETIEDVEGFWKTDFFGLSKYFEGDMEDLITEERIDYEIERMVENNEIKDNYSDWSITETAISNIIEGDKDYFDERIREIREGE